jgi:hypothetical protein
MGDAVGRHAKLAGHLSSTHAEVLQFFGEVLSGVYSGRYHGFVPFLVVINNLYIHRSRRFGRPREANPPLIIHPDAVSALPAAERDFKAPARRRGKIARAVADSSLSSLMRAAPEARILRRSVSRRETGALNSGECLDAFPGGKVGGALVPIADKLSVTLAWITRYVKRNRVEGASTSSGQGGELFSVKH